MIIIYLKAKVSPTTIRLRILKASSIDKKLRELVSFTHHDPFEDTERELPKETKTLTNSFTHHDPFEDTERNFGGGHRNVGGRFHPPRSV